MTKATLRQLVRGAEAMALRPDFGLAPLARASIAARRVLGRIDPGTLQVWHRQHARRTAGRA